MNTSQFLVYAYIVIIQFCWRPQYWKVTASESIVVYYIVFHAARNLPHGTTVNIDMTYIKIIIMEGCQRGGIIIPKQTLLIYWGRSELFVYTLSEYMYKNLN